MNPAYIRLEPNTKKANYFAQNIFDQGIDVDKRGYMVPEQIYSVPESYLNIVAKNPPYFDLLYSLLYKGEINYDQVNWTYPFVIEYLQRVSIKIATSFFDYLYNTPKYRSLAEKVISEVPSNNKTKLLKEVSEEVSFEKALRTVIMSEDITGLNILIQKINTMGIDVKPILRKILLEKLRYGSNDPEKSLVFIEWLIKNS